MIINKKLDERISRSRLIFENQNEFWSFQNEHDYEFALNDDVNSSQLVTRNVVIVNYVDAWVRWWIIFIKWLHNVLYKWFSISSHVKYSAHMLNTRFVT
jgi:hypothetical protein